MLMAIDPGTLESAFVIVDDDLAIVGKGKMSNEDLRVSLIDKYRGIPLVIEMLASYGMPVGAEVFTTCVWIGRFIEASKKPFKPIFRKDVKMHLCGTMKAKDSNIRQALIDRFGPPGTKKNPGKTYGLKADMWAALAVAVTAYDKLKVEEV